MAGLPKVQANLLDRAIADMIGTGVVSGDPVALRIEYTSL